MNNDNKLSVEELASYFDYVRGNNQSLEDYCQKAKKYKVKCLATGMFEVKYCKDQLRNTNIKVSGAISFPGGDSSIDSKLQDIQVVIDQGGDEIDYVISQYHLEISDWDYLFKEMKTIADFCRNNNIEDKAIIEMCKLNQEQKIKICNIARMARPAYIKTSTGYSFGGATLEDVKLMKGIVGDVCKIKAAGGISDFDTALKFIDAGAGRIGASAAINILDNYKQYLSNNHKK